VAGVNKADFEVRMVSLGYALATPGYEAEDGGNQLWLYRCDDHPPVFLFVARDTFNEQVLGFLLEHADNARCCL
jgi:hypothetical protein